MLVACPARVPVLAEILRDQVVRTHDLRVSKEDRESKTAALYDFITSERCAQLLNQVETLIDDIEGVDLAEKKAHDAVWQKRGRLLRTLLKSHGDFCFEINRAVGTAEAPE